MFGLTIYSVPWGSETRWYIVGNDGRPRRYWSG